MHNTIMRMLEARIRAGDDETLALVLEVFSRTKIVDVTIEEATTLGRWLREGERATRDPLYQLVV